MSSSTLGIPIPPGCAFTNRGTGGRTIVDSGNPRPRDAARHSAPAPGTLRKSCAIPEQRRELLRRLRPAKQKALDFVTVQRFLPLQL